MLLRHSLKLEMEAQVVEQAVQRAITDGCRTSDLGGTMTTAQMTNAILERI
jgi:3-isopropylmalate dehydrogenase